ARRGFRGGRGPWPGHRAWQARACAEPPDTRAPQRFPHAPIRVAGDEGRRMIVLGLNAYHGDSSACLIRDGALVAAAEEERFRRVKHWAGFPSQAIAYCLAEGGVTLSDVDHVALNQDST